MTKSQIALVLLLLSSQIAFSQTKEIKGDTAYWFKENKTFKRNFNLTDFEKSTDDFNFRLQYYGQVIEIEKNSLTII